MDLPKEGKEGEKIFRFSLRFDPSGQQEKVKKRVGPKGENLAGKSVVEKDGVRILHFQKFVLL